MPWSTFGSDGQRKYLTRAEADRFLMVAKKETIEVYSFCWFIAVTGCRISEALMTTAQCVDFEAGLVTMESLKKRRTGVYRSVPLPVTLLDALRKWFHTANFSPDQRLWPWSRMTGYRRITEVMAKAGISGPWATPKGLRHAFGVRAVQSGAPLHMVQRWLGHADMKTTAIYAGAVGPEERDIASRTWLKQDSRTEKPQPAYHPSPVPESEWEEPPMTHPDDIVPPTVPVMAEGRAGKAKSRKPWFRRSSWGERAISTCQLIQFYLFRSKFFDDIS